jgi:hypothetical protein
MQVRLGLPLVQCLFAVLMIGGAVAMPLPEVSTSQSSARETSDDPVAAAPSTAVQDAARDVTGVKDETRLPVEPPDGPAAVSEAAPAKPASAVNPQPVPELSRTEFCSTLIASAEKHNVPVRLFANLIWQESRFRPQAVSPVGALGVAQFMPRVAEQVGLTNPFNPLEALPAAARFFAGLLSKFGSLGLATAAYNAGSGRVDNWLNKRSKQLPKETQNYVRVITGHPVDHWRGSKAIGIHIASTSSMPCRSEAVFARYNQADLPEQRQAAEAHTPMPKIVQVAFGKGHAPIARAKLMVQMAKASVKTRAKQVVASAKVVVKPAVARLAAAGKAHVKPVVLAAKTAPARAAAHAQAAPRRADGHIKLAGRR